MSDPAFPYVWVWRQRTWAFGAGTVRGPWFGDGVDRAGQRCRVVVRDGGRGRNTALIEFADGYQVITSRGGLRKVTPVVPGGQAPSRQEHADATRRGAG